MISHVCEFTAIFYILRPILSLDFVTNSVSTEERVVTHADDKEHAEKCVVGLGDHTPLLVAGPAPTRDTPGKVNNILCA